MIALSGMNVFCNTKVSNFCEIISGLKPVPAFIIRTLISCCLQLSSRNRSSKCRRHSWIDEYRFCLRLMISTKAEAFVEMGRWIGGEGDREECGVPPSPSGRWKQNVGITFLLLSVLPFRIWQALYVFTLNYKMFCAAKSKAQANPHSTEGESRSPAGMEYAATSFIVSFTSCVPPPIASLPPSTTNGISRLPHELCTNWINKII